MSRRLLLVVLVCLVFASPTLLVAADGQLVPDNVAARSGLTRPWFAQMQLDGTRAKVTDVLLFDGTLYVQASNAMIQAFDAETGKVLWSRRVGLPDRLNLTLSAKGNLLAAINGTRLYVLDRRTGEVLYEKQIQDAPGAGPGLSTRHAFVPTVTGMMIAYRVEEARVPPKQAAGADGVPATTTSAAAPANGKSTDEAKGSNKTQLSKVDEPPLFCQSFGRALVAPLVTREFVGGEYVVWPTDEGCLNFGRIERDAGGNLMLKYRLETKSPIVAQPAYLPADPQVLGEAGIIFAATSDGFVHAIQEETGGRLWQYPTGEAISESPAVIDDLVFIATELGGMYCFEGKTGKNVWWADGINKFVAASKNRVYALDQLGRMAVLDRATGARVGSMSIDGVGRKIANTDTDRIYFVSPSGLIQCLRETSQTEPVLHGKDRKDAWKAESGRVEPEPEKPKAEKVDKPKTPPSGNATPAPKREPKKSVKKDDDGGNPFGGADSNPNGGGTKSVKPRKTKKMKNGGM